MKQIEISAQQFTLFVDFFREVGKISEHLSSSQKLELCTGCTVLLISSITGKNFDLVEDPD